MLLPHLMFFFRLHWSAFFTPSSHSFRLSRFHVINILLGFFRMTSLCFWAPLVWVFLFRLWNSFAMLQSSSFNLRSLLSFVSCSRGGRGGSNIKNRRGFSSENLNLTLKETIWARLKLFVTPKGDQSGRGLSKFWPLNYKRDHLKTHKHDMQWV